MFLVAVLEACASFLLQKELHTSPPPPHPLPPPRMIPFIVIPFSLRNDYFFFFLSSRT